MSKSSIKVCIGLIASSLPPPGGGGAERQALRLAHELASRGHAVQLFVRGSQSRSWRDRNLRIHEIAPPDLRWLGADSRSGLVFVLDLLRWIRVLHQCSPIEVAISYQTMKCGLIGSLFGVLTGTPHIVAVRGEGEFRQIHSWARRLMSLIAWATASAIVVQTPTIGRQFLEAAGHWLPRQLIARLENHLVAIPNGVDLPDLVEPPRGRGVLYVGRLTRRKAIDVLIEASREIPEVIVTIVGDGEDRRRLEGLAAGLPIHFRGSQTSDQVAQCYRDAVLLVQPSVFGEGLPNAVLEAMAYGRPVVATAIAGVSDLIVDGVSGCLVSPGDVTALRSALSGLLQAPDRLVQMGASARQMAGRYAWLAVGDQVEALVHQVLSRSRRRANTEHA